MINVKVIKYKIIYKLISKLKPNSFDKSLC